MTRVHNHRYNHKMSELWTDKYQPTSLEQIIGNEMVRDTIIDFLKSKKLPNMIFCGPHGSGKSTLARLTAQGYLGQYLSSGYMEVIGSINRGKNVVSEKTDKAKSSDKTIDGPNIINFIRKNVAIGADICKLIIVYDFDCMTTEAQMALRRIIEIYSNKVRFIFLCNNLSNIIEAIQSRTLLLKFNPVHHDLILDRLKHIAEEQKLTISPDIYRAICVLASGDIKQALNYLQIFSQCRSGTLESFYKIFNIPSIVTVQKIITDAISQKIGLAVDRATELINNGYNLTDILDIIIKVLIYSTELSEAQRAHMINETVKTVYINESVQSNTQLYKLIINIARVKGV